jgi:UDP-N-acetylmuramate dehydrogenase
MEIQKQVPLADKNWFGTGGAARYYCEPTSAHEFTQALTFAQEHNLERFILGLGANILISDNGFDGIVIRPQLKKIFYSFDNNIAYVTAGAGVTIQELIQDCFDHTVIGLEEFSGIPGSVGGSLFINIHYFQYFIGDFITSADIIEKKTGVVSTVDRTWFNFSYDNSRLHENTHYVVQVTFKLKHVSAMETAYSRGRSQEIIRHRLSRYPEKGTCGCFFRNFHDNEVTLVSNGKKMTYASYYFDKMGIKGELAHGAAQVSYKHANMIVNTGNASSEDILTVARTMQQMAQQHFGLMPQPECQLIGFNHYPLLGKHGT